MTAAQLRAALQREYNAGGARRTRALAYARRLQAAQHARARPPVVRAPPSPVATLLGAAQGTLDVVERYAPTIQAAAPIAAALAPFAIPLAALGVIGYSVFGGKSEEQLRAEAIAAGDAALDAAGRAGSLTSTGEVPIFVRGQRTWVD